MMPPITVIPAKDESREYAAKAAEKHGTDTAVMPKTSVCARADFDAPQT